MRLLQRAGLLAAASLLTASAVIAQDYPSRPVTFVVPFTPGAATDILTRMLGVKLEERLGKPFVVENRPGAGTVIGSNSVAKSTPDGYTLLMATSTPMAINVTLHKNLPFNPAADFVPLALVAQSPFVLIVNPSLPIRSVADLIALAKERQGRLTFGSAGPGSPHHLFAELFKSMTGIQASHVAYRGSVPALNDVVGGHIDFMFCDFASAAPMLQGGKVRPIGVSIATRIPAFPDIPTISESGLSGFDVAAWFMVVAPARTPAPVVDRLHHELTQILAAPEIQQRIAQLSLVPMAPQPVAGMQDFVKSEIVRWGKVVHDAGIAGSE